MAATCPVEVRHDSGVLASSSEDVARHGLYVRTEAPLPLGQEVIASVALPDRSVAELRCIVAHVLDPAAARTLGRSPGMGLQLTGEPPAPWLAFVEGLETAAQRAERPLTIVILDRSGPLRERLESNLVAGGFEASAVGDVAAAVDLCRREQPDILLADARTQGSNPLVALKLLSTTPETADIAIVLMSEDATDLVRVQAYRRGVRDVIPKPFTDEELMIRLRRVGPRAGRRARHVSLRGVIEDVGIPTVLSLLEYEKRPGILVLARELQVGRIHVAEGRVRRAELPGAASPDEALDAMLQWKNGSFAFLPGAMSGAQDMDRSISSLLLEHARVHDEQDRRPG